MGAGTFLCVIASLLILLLGLIMELGAYIMAKRSKALSSHGARRTPPRANYEILRKGAVHHDAKRYTRKAKHKHAIKE